MLILTFLRPKIFGHGRFPEVGQKQKTERKKERKRPNDGNNNGARMAHAWRTHGARMAHASRLGQKKERKTEQW